MRSLQRNWRDMYYAVPEREENIIDEYGNETLETKVTYSEPKLVQANVSANVGQEAVNVVGTLTNYNRTVTYCGTECPITEGCRVWFGTEPTGSHNYVVVKVADSKNGYLIALREVTDRG